MSKVRILACVFAWLLSPDLAFAAEAPAEQVRLSNDQVLRGSFTQENPVKGFDQPMRTSGRFVVAPAKGLLWAIEKPMATTTIVTRDASVQDIGGLTVTLPIKNLQYLYDIVSAALIGQWDRLEKDFTISKGRTAQGWQLMLTPRPDGQSQMPYKTITVSGDRFINNIILTKLNGAYETVTFSEQNLATMPLQADETMKFAKIKK